MLTLRCRRHRNKQSEATTLGSFTIPEMAIKRQSKFQKDDFEFKIEVDQGTLFRAVAIVTDKPRHLPLSFLLLLLFIIIVKKTL